MTCDLSTIKIEFLVSGLTLRPYSLDIRRSRSNENNFDYVKAELRKEAGEEINNEAVRKEPVEIVAGENRSRIYRGWYKQNSVTLGESKSTLKISDPRKILRSGTVDKEWDSITLKNVVEYIVGRVQDEHNVLTGWGMTSPKANTSKAQHNTAAFLPRSDSNKESDFSNALADFAKELVPFQEGDGNFDFREESPYSALKEVCDIWETSFWVDQDGTLYIGKPTMSADIYTAGRGSDNWYISEWDLPNNSTPLKAAIVKGKKSEKEPDEDVPFGGDGIWGVVANQKKFQTRAAAGYLNSNELEETLVIDGKKETANSETLQRIARRKFFEEHSKGNRGSVSINAMVENNISQSQYAGVDIGDKIAVNNLDADCNKLKEGLYDITGLKHNIDGTNGWQIRLDVVESITDADKIASKFWHFDPTDPEMSQDNEADATDV